jgi:hypothetical protein
LYDTWTLTDCGGIGGSGFDSTPNNVYNLTWRNINIINPVKGSSIAALLVGYKYTDILFENITVSGITTAAVFSFTAGINCTCNNVSIVTHNQSYATLVSTGGPTNTRFINCTFGMGTSYAVNLSNATPNSVIFDGCIFPDVHHNGAFQIRSTNITIQNCHFTSGPTTPAANYCVRNFDDTPRAGISVLNNRFTGAWGIQAIENAANDWTISGNTYD